MSFSIIANYSWMLVCVVCVGGAYVYLYIWMDMKLQVDKLIIQLLC